jgi:hypothetical protein
MEGYLRDAYGERDMAIDNPPVNCRYWQDVADDRGCSLSSVIVGGRLVCCFDAMHMQSVDHELAALAKEQELKIKSLEDKNANLIQEMNEMKQEMKTMRDEEHEMIKASCKVTLVLMLDMMIIHLAEGD